MASTARMTKELPLVVEVGVPPINPEAFTDNPAGNGLEPGASDHARGGVPVAVS